SKPPSPTSLSRSSVRCRSFGPTGPATSGPIRAFDSTVRHGSRLSFWNTKPRLPPGPVSVLPSSRIVPEVAGSSPATMRRNVVLPQPLGPTTERNSPRSTATSMLRSASSSPNHFPKPEISSLRGMVLVPGPRYELFLDPAEARGHDDAGD